jgi:enoyl-CoA hydratase/carnithine racemase
MGRAMGAYMHATLRRLADADALVLGVLEGAAIGGGAELLSACDRVFAAPGARVGWTQARLGVSPGFGGGARLVRRIGAARALDVLLSPSLLSADDALAVGLIDEVAQAPLEAAQRYAERALALDPAALRGVKALLRAVARPTEAEAAAELDVFAGLWGAPPHAQAVTAGAAGGRKRLEPPREPAGPSRA